jgi:DNA helicase IV
MADIDELAREQAYFDEALEHRERTRHRLSDAPGAAASPKDAVGLRKQVEGYLGGLRAPEEAVAFGRVDNEDDYDEEDPQKRYYVGYHLITDDDGDALVISWHTPVGTRFYEASHADPLGVVRRRRYRFKGDTNTIEDFEDEVFADLVERVAELEAPQDMDDVLLADLERTRTGEMLDIVRTIRAAQHRLIRDDLDQLLLVQGGPGTGKTAVALHRVSWLLFNYRADLAPRDVAVIGPTSTFVRYIRHVLPSLGDQDVRQISLGSLGPDVRSGRVEPPEVVALKGETRMGAMLDRALRERVGVPAGPLELPAGNRLVRFEPQAVQAQIDRLHAVPYATGRQGLRDLLRRAARTQASAGMTGEIQPDVLDNFVDRLWPQLTAPAFLQELLGSEARLLRAAGDDFTAREVRLLYRRSAERLSEETWSAADMALLDHAHNGIAGQPVDRFRHIVVDEAQDLSPMQLASIRRRSLDGSMTILGDLAQSTGHWARDSWDDVLAALNHDEVPTKVVELDIGYRVPRQAFEIAARLLPAAAPTVTPPRVIRDGPEPVDRPVGSSDERAQAVVAEAMSYASHGLTVGVICPETLREAVIQALASHGVHWRDGAVDGLGAGINLLGPDDVKGLEFDAVVVVEPEAIATEYESGLRLLYVALTRTTRHLSIVHLGSLLPSIEVPVTPQSAVQVGVPTGARPDVHAKAGDADRALGRVGDQPVRPRVVDLLAASLADEVRDSLPERLWPDLVEALRQHLNRPRR